MIPKEAQQLARQIVLSAMYAAEFHTTIESIYKVLLVEEDAVGFVGSLFVHYDKVRPCVICDYRNDLLVTLDGIRR